MIVRIPREPIERFIKKGETMTFPENDKRMVTVRQPVQVYKEVADRAKLRDLCNEWLAAIDQRLNQENG